MSISWSQQTKLVASDRAYRDFFATDVAIDGNYAIVGAKGNDDGGEDSGSAYIFKKNVDDNDNETWSQQIKLLANDKAAWDKLGVAVAISGNYAIVGANEDDGPSNAGSAYIFKKNVDENDNETWSQVAKIRASDRATSDHFGLAVAISGNYAIVGSYDAPSYFGAAYIFKKSDTDETWTQQMKLVTGDSENDAFGQAVAISGNYAIVGAQVDDDGASNTGSAYIFKKSDTDETWSQQVKLVASDAELGDRFGFSVSISENYAIIGAYFSDDGGSQSGSAYIFKKDLNDNWTEQMKLVASDAAEGDQFGKSVSIFNKYAIVGANRVDGPMDAGSAYIFKKSDSDETWSQVAKIRANDKAAGDYFGWAVSISANYAIVGAYFDDIGAGDMGSAYIYKLTGDDNTGVAEKARAATIAAGETAKTNLRDNLGVAENIINKMTADITVTNSEISITTEIKNSIITSDGTQKETKTNIRKKRRDFFKILFADNLSESKIKMNSADIGLNETLKDTLGSRTVKEKVIVLKKNEPTPIVISNEIDADTGIYSELDTLDDSVVFDVGVANKNVTVTKTRDEDGATTAQWTVSYDGNEYIKEEGDQITLNSITFYIGSVYTDGSNLGIEQNGENTPLANLYIPFVDDTNVVASNDAIRTKRYSRINNIFESNPLDISFNALSSELGLDKTVGDKIKTNTKVLKANSTLDLNPATTDISNNLSAHFNIKAVGEYALIQGLAGGNFRIQVVADGKYQLRSEDGSTALVENKYKDGEQVTFRNVTFYFGSVTTNNSNDGISGDTVLDLASLNIRFDVEQLQDGQVQADEINNVAVVSDNGNKYSINESTIPTLYLFKGKTYRFNQTDGTNGGHPMKLYLEADKTTEYSNGVDISGTPGTDGYLEITVADNAPEELHYQCGAHPNMGGVFKIVSVNNTITSLGSLNSIRSTRHRQLRKIFNNNPSLDSITATTKDLGIDVTVGKTVKKQVIVYRANASSAVDLTDPSLITSKQGVYGDLKEVGDYLDFNTGHNNGAFRVKVNTTNPKTYVITNTVNDTKLLEPEFTDGQWITFRGVTLYFGGVYTSGTNDGITAADPYVFPINGNPYKLPDENANYCLYADNNTFITGTVSQLSKEKQEEMREWVIDRLGSDTNNGASLVTDGFFYSNLHINTTVGELVLDMESKVCNSNNVQGFKVKVNNSRDNTYLFKGEHKTTATISWEADGNIMSVDVDFFENPQIRNGIRMNTVVTKSNPIGLLVDDYEPSLLCVENSKNKLSMYNKLVNSLELGKRVKDDKLNLQKQGELWSRHNL